MPTHNSKYVTLDVGHIRTFKVEYDDRKVKGRTRSFKTEEEANAFAATISAESFLRIQQIDYRTLRLRLPQ